MKNNFVLWLDACRKNCVAFFGTKKAGTNLQAKSTKREEISKGAEVIDFIVSIWITIQTIWLLIEL